MRGLLLGPLWSNLQAQCRRLSSTQAANVDKGLLSKLRKQTGIPFINCKKALAKFDNNFDQAKEWLLKEAQKEGWARATKLQSRPMSQGLIAVLANDKQATMLEVNCETDFVAKNEKFLALVTKLVQDCNSHFENQPENKAVLDKVQLDQLPVSDQPGTLADLVALTVGNLGENMALRRSTYLRASDGSHVAHYVHPSNPHKSNKKLLLGKYGALVEMRPSNPTDPSPMPLAQLGSHLCQHIVGMNPQTIGEFSPPPSKAAPSPSQDADTVKEEGEEGGQELGREEEGAGGGDVTEEALLQQEFLLDVSLKVGDLLCMNSVEVKDFARYACGEESQGEKEQ